MATRTFTLYDRAAHDFDREHASEGSKVYPVQCSHVHRDEVWTTISTAPGRTNLSREIKLNGWLGTTNDVSETALGEWTVVSVSKRWLGDGRYRVDVKARS